ncbi:MAG TPA: indole-3-glycerol phosphate synthase TrpC [Bacteroidales bacterium]|nr:indole-3-glycerol phosphate synthase TrpC [Bacteroidales bacterium]
MTILDKIIAHKKQELSAIDKIITVGDLENSNLFNREIISLSEFLLDSSKTGIIAEFKRKSPSKGIINMGASVEEVTSGYFREGASGISVLTDNQFFGGSSADLSAAKENNLFPVLRKDFIIDEYQVIESKAIGADAILLIAAVLTKREILNLSRLARSLKLEIVLEVHELKELDAENQYINIIGVNNRNLKTFEIDTDNSFELADKISSGYIKISESGISSPQVINDLKIAGYNGFLIGEKFMTAPDPVKAFSEFVKFLM